MRESVKSQIGEGVRMVRHLFGEEWDRMGKMAIWRMSKMVVAEGSKMAVEWVK